MQPYSLFAVVAYRKTAGRKPQDGLSVRRIRSVRREEAICMEVTHIKGVLVATLVMGKDDAQEIAQMSESEIIRRARKAVGAVIPEHLIGEILIGNDGDSLQVSFSI
jgi:hypothetical protein